MVQRALAGVQELSRRDAAIEADGVERTGDLVLDRVHDPFAEVTHVNELQVVVLGAWRQALAAAQQARWPVGEAIGRVAGADDVAGPDERRLGAKRRYWALR